MPEKPYSTWLREQRARAKLTQQKLAVAARLAESTIRGLEQGRFLPREVTRHAIEQALTKAKREGS